jgi:hypothetical protein
MRTLVISGFCAYAPDLDIIPFLVFRKRLGLTAGHRVIGHHPILFVPLLAAALWLAGEWLLPGHVKYLIALGLTAAALHFIHDSTAPAGFHLLSPITKDWKIRFSLKDPLIWHHYRISRKGVSRASDEVLRAKFDRIAQISKSAPTDGEIISRLEPVTRMQIEASCICIALLALYAFIVGLEW